MQMRKKNWEENVPPTFPDPRKLIASRGSDQTTLNRAESKPKWNSSVAIEKGKKLKPSQVCLEQIPPKNPEAKAPIERRDETIIKDNEEATTTAKELLERAFHAVTIDPTDFPSPRKSSREIFLELESAFQDSSALHDIQGSRDREYDRMERISAIKAKLEKELSIEIEVIQMEHRKRALGIADFQAKLARQIKYLHAMSKDIESRGKAVDAAFAQYEDAVRCEYKEKFHAAMLDKGLTDNNSQ